MKALKAAGKAAWQLVQYVQWRLQAGNAHGLHSPFVYQLYTQVLRPASDAASVEATAPIEALRAQLLRDERVVQVTDFGAGGNLSASASSAPATLSRRISHIAQSAAKSPHIARALHRLVAHFKPQQALELGTSLGLSTAYQASAMPQGKLTSVEGCPHLAEIARQHLRSLHLNHVQVVAGNLDVILADVLAQLPQLDFVFFDANHRYTPTLRYFEQCLPLAHEGSLFIFDDIYWSAEMKQAWNDIKKHPSVTVTVDLFWIGLVFFRKDQAPQHFKLRL